MAILSKQRCAMAASVALLAACASPTTSRPSIDASTIASEQARQSAYVLETRAAEYRRVYDMAERLSFANAELCARQSQTIGLRLENLADYGRDFQDAARTLWALDNTPSVIWVGEGTPAALAGIRPRDRLISINGRAVPNARNASRQAIRLLRDASDEGAVALQLRRGAETVSVTVAPRQTCGYEVFMVDADAINAAADGRSIFINRGLIRFARSDEELALIIGHELAHNAMRHIDAMQQNAAMGVMGGVMLDLLAAAAGVNTGGAFTDAGGDLGRMMFAQEFESEADYVGMYFMVRAGYNIDGVEEFWRRMSAEHPRGIRLAYTHPNHAERFIGLAATREEIMRKRHAGLPLRPTMEGEAPPPPIPVAPAIVPEQVPAPSEPTPSDPLISAAPNP